MTSSDLTLLPADAKDRAAARVGTSIDGSALARQEVPRPEVRIGLAHKLRAYNLQEEGFDTVDANLELGLPADSREYGIGAQILVDLGVTTMRLMTNNPTKRVGLQGWGLEITEQVPILIDAHDDNRDYLNTKRDRMGHLIPAAVQTQPMCGEHP